MLVLPPGLHVLQLNVTSATKYNVTVLSDKVVMASDYNFDLIFMKEFLLLNEVSMFPMLERMSIRLEALAVQVVMVHS